MRRLLATPVATLGLAAPLVVGGALAGLFFWVALSRISYPYDLEWMEGGMLAQSWQLLQGRPFYSAPSADFVPFAYQPLFAVVVALLGKIFGLSMGVGRFVSFVSTLVLAYLIGRTVQRETGDWRFGLLGCFSLFALFPVTGYFFDLVRVDALFMALLVGALYVARYRAGFLLSATLFFLAYKTKQLALPFVLLAVPLLVDRSRKEARAFVALFSGLLIGDHIVENLITHRWYSFWVFKVASFSGYDWNDIHKGVWVKIVSDVPVFALAFVVFGTWRVSTRTVAASLRETWILAPLLGLVAALLAWARDGGFDNDFMPFYLFALIPALQAIAHCVRNGPPAIQLGASLLIAAQLFALAYPPQAQIPRPADYQAGQRVIDLLRSTPGPVLIPEHPYYAVLAGKEPSFHRCALDNWRSVSQQLWPEGFEARERSGYYSLIMAGGKDSLGGAFPSYRQTSTLPYEGKTFESVTGMPRTRPSIVMEPIRAGTP